MTRGQSGLLFLSSLPISRHTRITIIGYYCNPIGSIVPPSEDRRTSIRVGKTNHSRRTEFGTAEIVALNVSASLGAPVKSVKERWHNSRKVSASSVSPRGMRGCVWGMWRGISRHLKIRTPENASRNIAPYQIFF
jgi:hypothetical protein